MRKATTWHATRAALSLPALKGGASRAFPVTMKFAHGSPERNALERLYNEEITVAKCIELLHEAESQRPAGAEPVALELIVDEQQERAAFEAAAKGRMSLVRTWDDEGYDSPFTRGAYVGWKLARAAPLSAPDGWQPMETAPKDGTWIIARCEHDNAKYCAASGKDPVAEGWIAAVPAHWIDHNGGGWTWHGLCGVFTGWYPLPPLASTPSEKGQR